MHSNPSHVSPSSSARRRRCIARCGRTHWRECHVKKEVENFYLSPKSSSAETIHVLSQLLEFSWTFRKVSHPRRFMSVFFRKGKWRSARRICLQPHRAWMNHSLQFCGEVLGLSPAAPCLESVGPHCGRFYRSSQNFRLHLEKGEVAQCRRMFSLSLSFIFMRSVGWIGHKNADYKHAIWHQSSESSGLSLCSSSFSSLPV